MARKFWAWSGWTAGAVLLAYGAYTIGVYSGRSHQIQLETRRDALRLYGFLKKGDAIGAQRDGLLSEHQLSAVMETDTKLGKVLDAKIVKVHTSPLSVPVIVSLLVKREKGEYSEHVIRHGGDANGLDFVGPLERPPW